MLAWALRIEPGDPTFYAATLLLAVVWLVGALISGPVRAGRSNTRDGRRDGRAVVQSIALATLLIALFLVGAVVVARIPQLTQSVQELLDYARYGALPVVALLTAFNGAAEEVYFRGRSTRRWLGVHAVVVTTAVYALTTVPVGIPLLTMAAGILGTVTALQRRVTSGVLGPAVTHVIWSLAMLVLRAHALAIGA